MAVVVSVLKLAGPVNVCDDLYGCEMLMIPYCLDNLLAGDGKIVNPTHRPKFTSQKHNFYDSGTHFC
jgi:hypothetical protein